MKKLIFCFILSAFIFCSCGYGEEKYIQKSPSNFVITEGSSRTYQSRSAEETDYAAADNSKTSSERAKILSKIIANMEGIEEAYVLISGNAAIVGITTTTTQTEQALIKFKKDVEEKIKLSDKEIRIAAVTAAPDLVERIKKLQHTS